ncbi:hypothetical protein PhaeoP23_01775 [Phaeobacter piscinae]|uniref:Uncharacterized protein n=1 Tax=Phaeobacter piscinae TaxID=1580596 RepID=A0ABM6PDU8_9RHOB|nr:hypothetical protein PhaeoP36_01775 [Phaeobacter piscinae]AUQ86438.1 hypothetical protein PhaeoP42_01776 [Phaeobacter piscinae]AUR24321.1 hypothetical protein PhaeoP23_01775 [Phaeobacter piscinae]
MLMCNPTVQRLIISTSLPCQVRWQNDSVYIPSMFEFGWCQDLVGNLRTIVFVNKTIGNIEHLSKPVQSGLLSP